MSQHQTAKNKGNVLINSQGNFSSDDDATSMNKSSNKRVKRKKKPVEPDTESISVHELTNDEIVAQLRSFGMNPGPVGPSTRNVYIKKLEKYMSKEQAANNQEYSDKEEEIEVEQPTVVTRSSSRRKTAQLEIKSTRKSRITEHTTYNSSQPVHAHAEESDEAEDPDHFAATQPANISSATRRRPLRPRVNDQVKKTSEPIVATKPEEPPAATKVETCERRWLPVWLQVLATCIIIGFIYLVVQAMESNPLPPKLSHSSSD